MKRLGARIILLILLLAICVPIGVYFAGGNSLSNGGQAEIDELTVPDEDPIVSEDEAMEVVFAMLPEADYGDVLEFAQTYNEGGWIYEGSIRGDKVVYEYQVDGENGNILKWIVRKK